MRYILVLVLLLGFISSARSDEPEIIYKPVTQKTESVGFIVSGCTSYDGNIGIDPSAFCEDIVTIELWGCGGLVYSDWNEYYFRCGSKFLIIKTKE